MKKKLKNGFVGSTGYGSIGGQLMKHDFDAGALRPYIENSDGSGESYIDVATGESRYSRRRKKNVPVRNAVRLRNAEAALTRDEWKAFDDAVIRAAQPRLKAWRDLRSANSITIPQGMGKTVLESYSMGDITGAQINMDGLAIADQDRIHFNTTAVPLPIISKDFSLSLRQVMISRNGSVPLDTTLASMAGEKVAEEIEKLTIGIGDGYQFAGHSLYGYRNFPGRQTISLTHPDDGDWTPKIFVSELLQMVIMMEDAGFYGPYKIYRGRGWTEVLELDYSDTKGDNTLRARAMKLEGVSGMETLDFMPEWDMVMVNMTSRTARGIVGMDLTTLQWEQQGGLELKMKVMAIMVPEMRGDFYSNCGIVHGVATAPEES